MKTRRRRLFTVTLNKNKKNFIEPSMMFQSGRHAGGRVKNKSLIKSTAMPPMKELTPRGRGSKKSPSFIDTGLIIKKYKKPLRFNTTKTTNSTNITNPIMVTTTRRRGVTPPPANIHNSANTTASKLNKKLSDKLSSTKPEAGVTLAPRSTEPPLAPRSVTHSLGKLVIANDTNRVIHKTIYRTGRKPTKAIFDAAKQEGTYRTVMTDSKTFQSVTDRDQLTYESGFNSRAFFMPPPRSVVLNRDFMNASGFAGSLPDVLNFSDRDRSIGAYLSVMATETQYMIHNRMLNFPINFKIHVCRVINPTNFVYANTVESGNRPVLHSVFDRVFNTTTGQTGSAGGQDVGAIPQFYQHSSPTITQGSDTVNFTTGSSLCHVSLKGKGLYESDWFRSNIDIVETFQKKLEPGDYWNFKHNHSYGPGLDLKRFLSENHSSNFPNDGQNDFVTDMRFMPVNYFFIFEHTGSMCETKIRQSGQFDNYLGKSPGFVTFEYKTAYLAAKCGCDEPATGADLQTAVRYFVSDPSRDTQVTGGEGSNIFDTKKREIFVLPNNLKNQQSEATVDGQAFFPISSAVIQNIPTVLGTDG